MVVIGGESREKSLSSVSDALPSIVGVAGSVKAGGGGEEVAKCVNPDRDCNKSLTRSSLAIRVLYLPCLLRHQRVTKQLVEEIKNRSAGYRFELRGLLWIKKKEREERKVEVQHYWQSIANSSLPTEPTIASVHEVVEGGERQICAEFIPNWERFDLLRGQ